MEFYNGNFEACVIHVTPILSFLMTLTILNASTCDEGICNTISFKILTWVTECSRLQLMVAIEDVMLGIVRSVAEGKPPVLTLRNRSDWKNVTFRDW